MRQDRLADAGSVEGAAGAGPEEGADRLMRLDLADEHHAIVLGDAEIGGLAGPLHQLLHDRAGAVDQLAAAQERRADAIGLDADRPELLGSGRTRPCRGFAASSACGRRSTAAMPRGAAIFAERQPVASRRRWPGCARPRSSDCTALGFGRRVEGARPAALAFFDHFHRSRIPTAKKFFGNME